ncbi:MAG: geranylgeranylglycerol-phosphate geranylgeranyltransferase [bacterium]
MNFRRVVAHIRLLRPVNSGIVLATVAIACLLGGAQLEEWPIIMIASLSAALIAAGGYAINDYFDLEIDKYNRPDRPLPSMLVTPMASHHLWFLLSMMGFGFSTFWGIQTMAIAFFWITALYFYSRIFKRKVLVGNIIVALATALAFMYGAAAVGQIQLAIFPTLFAFLINMARELVKDAEDVEGDRLDDAKTFTIRYGIAKTIGLSNIILVVLIVLTLLPYALRIYHGRYLFLVMIVNMMLIYSILLLHHHIQRFRFIAPA